MTQPAPAVAAPTPADSPLVLLVNLGTPEAPTAPAVRRYLAEFLSDRRVVAIPPLFWQPLLRGVILPLRGPKSAAKYASIWMDGGSPLMVHTRDLAAAVQRQLPALEVDYAMRYGAPSLRARLDAARQAGRRVLLLPLYPQYSTTTTASIGDVAQARHAAGTRMVQQYSEDPAWVAAVVDSIASWRQQHGGGEHLLFSFHGLPQRVANNGDPYPQQCERSAALIAQGLGLSPEAWTLTYQSRFGSERWLQPATDAVLKQLAERGIKRVDVACPGFAVDCLETLEEVGMQFAEGFAEHGGQLRYIPCLNASDAHAGALARCIERELHAWG